jgi:tetratricopeptide (TPR) repeat protein
VNIVENCVVVWLDLSIDDDSDETQEIEKQFQQVFSTVITYTDPKECLTFIDGVKNEKVFVILSGTPNEEFISKAQNSSKVDFVYVLGSNQKPVTKWSTKYPQVRGSYKSVTRLCQKLKKDIKTCDHDMIGYGFAGGSSSYTTIENDQNMPDDETAEEFSSNTETDDNQSMVDGEATEELSSSIPAKSNPTMVDGKTMGGSSSSNIPVKSSVTKVDGKLTGESSSNISAKSTLTTIDGKTTGGSSSTIPVKSNPTTVNGKTMGGSSSTTPVKSSVKMVDGKLAGGTSSKIPAESSPTMVDVKTTGESQPNIRKGSTPDQVLLMYDQLFREIVLSLKEEEVNGICEFCLNHIENDQEDLKFISNLKTTYSKYPPVRWYSTEACLYKILNKALRIHAYDVLYELRVFIRHLHEDIIAHQKKTPWENKPLYRGQGLEKEQFEYICSNKGAVMCFSSFLSTSASKKEALKFARRACDGKRVAVLMKFKVDKNVSVPFANISKVSDFESEEEWLWSMGSVFRIGQTQPRHDKIWVVNLTAVNDNNERLAAMKEYFKDSLNDKNVYLNFARLMHQLAYWKQSKALYLTSIKTENEWHRQAAIYNNLGLILSELKDYDEALEYYYQSLNLELQHGGSNSKDLASTYNNIGTLYYKLEKMDLAIENFQLAIKVYNDTSNDNQEIMATLYNNIALILNCKGEHKKAMENNERCLNIRINIFPDIDPSLATTYNSIASTYYYQQSYTEAVKFAEKAVEIDNLALPPDHPQTKIHKENLNRFKELASTKS